VFTCTAGDVFEWASATQTPQAETLLQVDFMGKALGLLQYDAVALGEKDLAYGRARLQQIANDHGVKFVCANAVDRTTKEPIFPPYVVAEQAGVRVAFIGVVSPERHIIAQVESALLEHQIELKDPTEMTLKILDEVRAKADLVVLLSHTGIETSEFLAEDLPVDVVIVGHYPAIQEEPKKVADAVFAMAGSKSDRFGTLDLTLSEDLSTITAFSGDAVRLLSKGPEVAEVAAHAAEWDRRDKEAKRERQLAQQREREDAAKKEIAGAIHERGGVFGAESCKPCHEPVYETWMKTPHATAFATLAEADSWDDPECVGCHVTGVEDKTHVADVNLPPEVWNVQCEECHGSGLQHARDGSYVTGGEATCLVCHNPENSPEFDYAVYSAYGIH
jgi:hypothetical protein